MKNWYLNLSIKYKLLFIFYFFLALLTALFYYYNNKIVSDNIMENVGNANIHILEQINSNVRFLRQEVEDMTAQLMIQPEIQNYIQPPSSDLPETQKLYIDSSLRNAVNLLVSKGYVSSLSICGFQNNSVPFVRSIDGRFSLPNYQELSQLDFFQQAVEGNGRPIWLENSEETYLFAANNRYNRIFMIRMIREYHTYENLGLIVVGISEPALRQEYTRGINTADCAIAIFNQDGNLVSEAGSNTLSHLPSDKLLHFQQQKSGYEIYGTAKESFLLSYTTDKKTGWTYLYMIPTNTLTKELKRTANYLVPFSLSALLLSIPLTLFASALIIRPLQKLLSAMNSFQTGNFQSFLSFHYEDEIGQLGKGYNEMVTNLAELIDRVYTLQLKEREAELNALQSQINPHFLYNTLDSIYWKAQAKGESEIAEMVWALSNLFRSSLSKGTRYTTVAREFQFLEQYLRLQHLRYGAKISYQVRLDDNAKDQTIPKLLLQPLVENAIYHGLEPKEGPGKVTVLCCRSGDKLKFKITDDGVGMEPAVVSQLNKQTNSCHNESYAIENIKDRLMIIYQNNFSFHITSKKETGTTVSITLPILQEEEYDKTFNCR